jgi:hypothetical protein
VMLQGQALDIKFALLDPNWDFRATDPRTERNDSSAWRPE